MYASQLAQAAYGQADAPIRSERGTEYAAFERITARLKQAEANPGAFKARAQAVFENRQLWTILAKDVMDPTNALPAALRAQIVYLYEFTQVQSRAALSQKASLMPMVEVNTAVMRGLRGEKGTP